MTKAPISLCIIVKNEPLLEDCLKSIKDYVEEIVIVDTGSADNTIQIAQKYAHIFKQYTECNDPETGFINNFSQARQYSFSLSTQPWIMWCDGDDIITGGENLINIINSYDYKSAGLEAVGYLFPYEYAYNDKGQCICLHYRERLISNRDKFHWVNPVHEVLIPKNDTKTALIPKEGVVFKHRRQYGTKTVEPGRNLRILKKYIEKIGDTDARQLYYIGLEYCNVGLVNEAIQNLTKYTEISGWDDEKCMACLKLVDIYHALGQHDNALQWAFKSIATKENWGECYFALAKTFYFLAAQGGVNEIRNWEKCSHFANIGLNLPLTKTLLFVNPLDREYDIHRFLNMALFKLGNVQAALDSANIALKSQPHDANLIFNKNLYETLLTKHQALNSIDALKNLGDIDQLTYDTITGIINKQITHKNISPPTTSITNNQEWQIPSSYDYNTPPLNISSEQLQACIIMLWKQIILKNDFVSASNFLESMPNDINKLPSIQTALSLTEKYISNTQKDKNKIPYKIISENEKQFLTKTKLDIIFFAGDGVEEWNPETVNETGIGGSELMMLELSKRLASFGHRVRVYNSCGKNGRKIYDGVEYYQTNEYKDLNCDVLIVSRRADMLGDQYQIKAKLKLLWVHDVCAIAATNELLLKADKILALSQWHKQNIINTHHVHPNHVLITRNGIDIKRFENKNIKRDKFKCINASSPDRSWPVLLDIWPKIKERVSQSELHLYYGFKNWKYSAQHDQNQMNLINALEKKIKEMEPLGVIFHDRVSQDELANEFLSAGVLLHPTWFAETFGITFANAQAAGLKIITSPIGALNEIVGERGILIPGEWTTKEYQDKFIDCAIDALNADNNANRLELQKYAREHFGLDTLAKDWEKMFYDLIEEKKKHPMIPYQPTELYRNKK